MSPHSPRIAAVAAFVALAFGAQASQAAPPLNVTTTADVAANFGVCGSSSTTTPSPLSLREAVCLANNLGGTVTINIPAGHYNIDNGELIPGLVAGQTINFAG